MTQFLSEVNHVWGELFLKECERLATYEPWLDSEELEAKAEERANYYCYLWNKERLPDYYTRIEWRMDMR